MSLQQEKAGGNHCADEQAHGKNNGGSLSVVLAGQECDTQTDTEQESYQRTKEGHMVKKSAISFFRLGSYEEG